MDLRLRVGCIGVCYFVGGWFVVLILWVNVGCGWFS